MDIDRRKRYFGDMLSEEQLTRTELPEIEDAIVEELALPIVSCKESATQDTDTWGRIKFE
jgi:hypothetical protein|nr:MAG TPA: hypothetical protein [Caudoviricetes sp.]DAK55086.1 MAG TPA: hypothetical protein [Caudoviricetes sp.]